jgi:hypothetical protein
VSDREYKHMKDMLDSWGEADVEMLIRDFFASTDIQVTRKNYTIVDLFLLAPMLRLLPQRQRQDRRTEENVDAARRATGRHK